MGVEYCLVCPQSACVCVCPRSYLRNYTSDLCQILVHVTYGRGSVIFWRRSDKLCTSGFMDDVIFAHKPRLFDVAAQLKRSAHAACKSSSVTSGSWSKVDQVNQVEYLDNDRLSWEQPVGLVIVGVSCFLLLPRPLSELLSRLTMYCSCVSIAGVLWGDCTSLPSPPSLPGPLCSPCLQYTIALFHWDYRHRTVEAF